MKTEALITMLSAVGTVTAVTGYFSTVFYRDGNLGFIVLGKHACDNAECY